MRFTAFGVGGNTPAPPQDDGFSFGTTPAPAALAPAGGDSKRAFGGSSSADPAHPAPDGGFGFGGGPPAPSTSNAPAPSYSFGGSTPAPAPSSNAPPAPSFSFGSTPAPAPQPTAATPAPATAGFSLSSSTPASAGAPTTTPAAPAPASTGGFSFGNTSRSTPAPATAAPAAGGFSFGNTGSSAPGATAPATGSFSLGNTGSIAPAPGAPTTNTAPVYPPTLKAEKFDIQFPNLNLWQQIQKFSMDESVLGGQELHHCVATSSAILKPRSVEWVPPNTGLRQQLAARPKVTIGENISQLSPKVLEKVSQLSTDLRISEAFAFSLYAQVMGNLDAISSLPLSPLVDQGMPENKYPKSLHVARDFYFYQEGLQLRTLLHLLQLRMQGSPVILQATVGLVQAGLVTDLIQVVRDYSQKIQQLQNEVSAKPIPGNHVQNLANQLQQLPIGGNELKQPPNFAHVHLLWCQQERQVAAECLFFIAYHTQLTASEMASLLDVIKDLANALPQLCPFTNVPSPYEPTTGPTSATTAWPSSSNAPFTYALKEKNPLVWQNQLVAQTFESGQPQVLQSVSLLIVAAISAMETRQELYNRDIHGPNSFGIGNQFLPPDNPVIPQELQSRISPQAAASWQRKDIWGVLAASYALLLRSAPSNLQSPRPGSSNNEVRVTARECLVMPSSYKSFSFCRLMMLPALERISASGQANTSEFGLSILAEAFSNYLDVLAKSGILPLSRAKYEKEETEELNLRRAQQAQESHFNAWSGKIPQKQEVVPSAVDLMARPDCFDDMLALACDLCKIGKEYAQHFWDTELGTLSPSAALLRLERSQAMDDSLMPTYLSFLAALVNDEASANAVYELLARPPDLTSSPKITWATLIFNLRWYAQELSAYEANTVSKPASSSADTTASTSYYYNLEGNATPSNTNSASSGTSGKSSSSTSKNKPKELSEMARFRVTSHLSVMQTVARHSSVAQMGILSITLPVGNAMAAGGDDALLVLFKLAIAPLTPVVRGATLSTIASLLDTLPGAANDQRAFLQLQAKNAWEYLESCPLLPIYLLDQYRNSSDDRAARVGLGFPPSSQNLSANHNIESMLPKDPNYGLLYEMEQIEAKVGWYPSTEGFLSLLKSLVCAAGCPSNLGHNWRPRVGCAPYFEYVIDFILPRVFGTSGSARLPFRVPGDQCRLVSKALQVLEAVVSRYSVPTAELKKIRDPNAAASVPTVSSPSEEFAKKARKLLGIQSVVDQVFSPDPSVQVSPKELTDDYKNMSAAPVQVPDMNSTNTMQTAPPTTGLPATKSPGFMILADILSSNGGVIFESLARILTDYSGVAGIDAIYGTQSDRMALTYALFGTTPPNTNSAKEGAKEGGPKKPLQTLLKPLSPFIDKTQFDNASEWREHSIVLALRLLCAAAAHEEAFIEAVTSSKEPLKSVPVLRFQQIRFGSSNFRVNNVALAKLARLLFCFERSQNIRKSIVDCVGYTTSSSESQVVNLGPAALSLVFYMQQCTSAYTSLSALCGEVPASNLSHAVAKRLLSSAKHPDSDADMQVVNLIFHWILSELRLGRAGELTASLLGLPSREKGGNWEPGSKHYAGVLVDCFDAILELLKDIEYATSKPTSSISSQCLEIIFRLYDLLQGGAEDQTYLKVVLYTAERLRSVDFWNINLLIWLSERGTLPLQRVCSYGNLEDSDPNILNSIAWLLKGLAIEIKLLVGFANNSVLDSGLGGFLSPRSVQCKAVLSILFGSEEAIMLKVIESIPLERVSIDPSLFHPQVEALRIAAYDLPGPADIVSDYQLVDFDLALRAMGSSQENEEVQSMGRWVGQWNAVAAWDCAASHLSNAAYIILSASLYSSESLRSHDSIGQIVGLQAHGQASLLAMILQRLMYTEASRSEQHRGMDTRLFPSATRNLSNAALILSESISGFDRHEAPSASELLAVSALLSQTLAFSSIGDEAAVEVPTRHERTTVLASALSALLRLTSHAEPGLVRQYRDEFFAAARSLSRLCMFKVDSSQGIVSLLARSAFGSLLDACSDDTEEEQMHESFIFMSLQKTFIGSLMDLVVSMDENICSLLQTIALQPFGAEILIDGGICGALQAAARAYLVEETRVSVHLQNASFNKAALTTPRFLMSHLKLLSTLMSSKSLPDRKSVTLCIHATETAVLYKEIIKRLCFNFPVEADVLRWFMRCFIQALSLAQPIDVNERHDLLAEHSTKLKQIFADTGLVENGLLMLCQQLWENPLPKDLLLQLPSELQQRQQQAGEIESTVVSIKKEAQRSWWDVLDQMLVDKEKGLYFFDAPIGRSDFWGTKSNRKWDENKFEYGIVAMDVLSLGISLLKRLNRIELIDSASIARGIYHCSFAAQTIGSRFDEISLLRGNPSSIMDTGDNRDIELEAEYLSLFGNSVSHAVEELLISCMMLLGEDRKENDGHTAKEQFRIAIDQVSIESKGVGCLSSSSEGDKRLKLVKLLCTEIKK